MGATPSDLELSQGRSQCHTEQKAVFLPHKDEFYCEATLTKMMKPLKYAHILLWNLSELLEGERFSILKDYVNKDDVDRVLFDLPPISVSSDLFSFAPLVDGIVLVVRPGMYSSERIITGAHMLKKCQLPILGMVMNEVDTALRSRLNYIHSK